MKQIKWHVSESDLELIQAIVLRACALMDIASERFELAMDITACHANGCPLKLEELLNADKFDFIHDVRGIQRHIDRKTGQLLDCFAPRFEKVSRGN